MANHKCAVGDKILTESKIADLTGSSRITVRHAIRELKDQGFLESKRGKGTFLKKNIFSNSCFGVVNFLAVNDPNQSFPSYIQADLKKGGYDIKYMITGEKPDSQVLDQIKNSSGIIACGYITLQWVDFFLSTDIPTVIVGSNPVEKITTVKYDYKKAANLLVRHFALKNMKSIGLVCGQSSYLPAVEMHAGWLEGMNEYSLACNQKMILWSGIESTWAQLDLFFNQGTRFDAVIVESGALVPVLAYFWENRKICTPALGFIEEYGAKYELRESLTAAVFPKSIFQEAVEILFLQTKENRVQIVKIDPEIKV